MLVEKSQDKHGGNVAFMIFANPIVSRIATGFQQFLQNFQLYIFPKKLSTTCINDFQTSNSEELNFSVIWSSNSSFFGNPSVKRRKIDFSF